jgi:hypothetical protein
MSGPYENVNVYTATGQYVTTLNLIPSAVPPETVVWGTRAFVRDLEGHYIEGTPACPPMTAVGSEQPLTMIRINR